MYVTIMQQAAAAAFTTLCGLVKKCGCCKMVGSEKEGSNQSSKASHVHPLDFVHFHGTHQYNLQSDKELKFCGDKVNWNCNSFVWNNLTAWTELDDDEDAPFNEIASRPPRERKPGAYCTYDTRRVVPMHASYAVPTYSQPTTVKHHEIHNSILVPVLQEREKTDGIHASNIILSPRKTHCNLIICISVV
jgi:hypothetical protein